LIIFLLESKRTPFDHAETESEVVAGYAVEYSGPMLLMLYLAEYLHLVISSLHFVIFFLGGWFTLEYFFFLPPVFLTTHDVYY
jgi:NADH:ubiquinone oxidoreductase subunit H